MAQRSPVPKFGNWENEDNVPYTVFFEKARKSRTGSKTSQNSSEECPEILNPKPEGRRQEEAVMSRHGNEGDGQQRKPVTGSPIQHDFGACRAVVGSPVRGCGGRSGDTASRRAPPQRAASLQVRNQAKNGGKGDGISSESIHGELAHMTPGRSRLRSITRGDDSADQSPAVPKFGDWDETDPASADGYTHIFNKVREERQGDKTKVPIQRTQTYRSNGEKQNGDGNSIKVCCCFPWDRS